MSTSALDKAVSCAGGQAALARQLAMKTGRPVRQGHIWAWLNRTRKVPPEHVLPIESITGVSRHELRPDLYPVERQS